MKVLDATVTHVRVPPATPWSDALSVVSALEFVVLDLVTDDGVTGTGLAYTVGPGGSAVAALLRDDVLPVVVGSDLQATSALWTAVREHLRRAGTAGIATFALSAVDIAAWDAVARAQDLPLYRALGGDRTSVPAYGSGIDLGMTLPELEEHVASLLGAGYETVKIKVGRRTLGEDVERVRLVRGLLGDERRLLLDANQGWTVDEAVRRMRALEVFRPDWIEEPLVAEDVAGHARLRSATGVPVAVGESLYDASQFAAYIAAGAVDVVQADLGRVGGFTGWLKIAALAEVAGLPVAPHFLLELSVHGLCAIPNGLILEDVRGGSLTELGLLADPFEVVAGHGTPPTRAGHGLTFDRERLAQLAV